MSNNGLGYQRFVEDFALHGPLKGFLDNQPRKADRLTDNEPAFMVEIEHDS